MKEKTLSKQDAVKEISEVCDISKCDVCLRCGKHGLFTRVVCQADDLLIRLTDPDEQRRYEEVRDFRDKHGYPMWAEQ